MTTPVRAVIFDYDGLIVDSERIEADHVIEIIGEWGTTLTYAEFGHLFGSVDADHHWEILVQEWCGRALVDLERELHARLSTSAVKEQLPLLPGVRELLDAARDAGIRVGLGTGNTYDRIERRLGRHGIFGRFEAVVTRAEVALGKPAPDIYLEVSRRLEVDPAECVVLEDSVPGCAAAIAAGMSVIVCPSVVTAHCDFPADIKRVDTLRELLPFEW